MNQVRGPFVARLLVVGSSNTDMTVRLARLPAPGETVLGGSFLTGPGGKGANQAVAAARAGGRVTFVSAVGDDRFGRDAVDGYRRDGIDVKDVRVVPGAASGVALILVGEGGENLIGVAPGANAGLGSDDIDRLPAALFQPDGLLLIAGLEVPLSAVAGAVARGSAAGMRVVLNPAPVDDGLIDSGFLDALTVITPNRVELGRLTGRSVETPDHVAEAARLLRDRGPKAVVVTLGADGCLVVDSQGTRAIPSHPVDAVDTVGAGDAFTAALAVGLAEGRSLDDSAAWATAAAALSVTKPGAQASMARRDAIDRLAATRR